MSKITEAKTYVKQNNMDSTFCILINYNVHSGLKRAYLVNLTSKMTFDSFLVSHGCGNSTWGKDESKTNAVFSNEFESHCSSLGKFSIGQRGNSEWGIHIKYLLKGKEKTNSNALKRYIVLHGWSEVSDEEIYPKGTPEGWGCPAISNQTMTVLDSILNTKRNVLLWGFR